MSIPEFIITNMIVHILENIALVNPMHTLKDSIPLALAKQLNRLCRRLFQLQLNRPVCQINFRSGRLTIFTSHKPQRSTEFI